jgi:hypothetical protein
MVRCRGVSDFKHADRAGSLSLSPQKLQEISIMQWAEERCLLCSVATEIIPKMATPSQIVSPPLFVNCSDSSCKHRQTNEMGMSDHTIRRRDAMNDDGDVDVDG